MDGHPVSPDAIRMRDPLPCQGDGEALLELGLNVRDLDYMGPAQLAMVLDVLTGWRMAGRNP